MTGWERLRRWWGAHPPEADIVIAVIVFSIAIVLRPDGPAPLTSTALLPDTWDGVLKYLPSNAGQAFSSTVENTSPLDATTGVIVFSLWVMAAVAAAAWTFTRRDA